MLFLLLFYNDLSYGSPIFNELQLKILRNSDLRTLDNLFEPYIGATASEWQPQNITF